MRGRAPTAALSALLLALALAACGGGGSDSSGEEGPRVVPLRAAGGGSAQFRVKGADNSIANYGTEASRRELRAFAAVAHDYLAAIVTGDWAAACRRLSTKVERGVQRLAAATPEYEGEGCAAALATLIGKVSPAEGREATTLDAAALRREDGLSFLIYRGAGGRPFFLKFFREDGDWMVGALSPTALG